MTRSLRVRRKLVCALAGLPVAMFMAGCGGSGGPSMTAQARTFNAYIPASGASDTLTFSSSGTTISSNQFGQFMPPTGYTNVNSDTFSPSASGADLSAPITGMPPISVTALTQVTVVAIGQGGTSGATTPQLVGIPSYSTLDFVIPGGKAAV